MSNEVRSAAEPAEVETGRVAWENDTRFSVDGVDLIARLGTAPTAGDRIVVYKPRSLVERHVDLLTDLDPDRMIELGVWRGGSIALSWLLARPQRLVAVELDETPVPQLTAFIRTHELDDVVRVHYGVDQADRPVLRRIVADEFDGEPIDLVVDDASHLYAQTRASFEVLFPHVRPGGLYVIEDWKWNHGLAKRIEDQLAARGSSEEQERAVELEEEIAAELDRRAVEGQEPDPPLSVLLLELLLVKASGSAVIDDITVNVNWIVVRRGEEWIDPDGFRLSACYRDHFDFLEAWASAVPTD